MEEQKICVGRIVSVNISKDKGTKKTPVGSCLILEDYGLEGDSHSRNGHRQVSLLAEESIIKMRALGLDLRPGDFAENLTTQGINLHKLPVGTKLAIGDNVLLEVSQIGKKCHKPCTIYYRVGDCLMPKEGIFARVLAGGMIYAGDPIYLYKGLQAP